MDVRRTVAGWLAVAVVLALAVGFGLTQHRKDEDRRQVQNLSTCLERAGADAHAVNLCTTMYTR